MGSFFSSCGFFFSLCTLLFSSCGFKPFLGTRHNSWRQNCPKSFAAYLVQIKFQIRKAIGCVVDAVLLEQGDTNQKVFYSIGTTLSRSRIFRVGQAFCLGLRFHARLKFILASGSAAADVWMDDGCYVQNGDSSY